VQAVFGAPDGVRRGLDEDVALVLDSGWWVTLRNQFARAAPVAIEILGLAKDALTEATAQANAASGEAARELWERLRFSAFHATSPDYWT
jgi:hypothetical protein